MGLAAGLCAPDRMCMMNGAGGFVKPNMQGRGRGVGEAAGVGLCLIVPYLPW